MTKNNVVKEKKGVATEEKAAKKSVTLTFDQSRAWDIYRDDQISKLLANAMDRLHEPIIKVILRYGIARKIDQAHNAASLKISAYEAGTQLVLDDLFSNAGRATAKTIAYEQAMELFLDAAVVNKDYAKAVIRDAKKIDTGPAWERAVVELKRIIG